MFKQEVLAALDAARGRYISGQELAAQLGVSRTAVWKAVAALRRDGIPIKAVTNRGYTLAQSVDVLNAASVAVQLDEAIGIRVLPLGDLTPSDIADGVPEDIQSILDQYVPGATAMVCPVSGTVKEETVLTSYPIQMGVSAQLSEDDVYTIMKAIYDNYAELKDVHAWGAQWIPENFVQKDFKVPYHDGAVKLYKEVGLWTEEAEATQNALLAK